ncbi:hypothetical protein D3C75_766770 [compost metagenome]
MAGIGDGGQKGQGHLIQIVAGKPYEKTGQKQGDRQPHIPQNPLHADNVEGHVFVFGGFQQSEQSNGSNGGHG